MLKYLSAYKTCLNCHYLEYSILLCCIKIIMLLSYLFQWLIFISVWLSTCGWLGRAFIINTPPPPSKKKSWYIKKLFQLFLHMKIVIELCWKKTQILLIFLKGQILIVLSWEHTTCWFDDWQLFQVLAGVWEIYSYVTTHSRLLTNLPFRQVHINLVMHGANPGTPEIFWVPTLLPID